MYVYHWSIIIFSFSLGEFNSPSTQIWTTRPKPVPHRWPQSNQGVTKRRLGKSPWPSHGYLYIYIYIHSWETGGFFRPYYWLPEGLSWASCVLFINFYIPWNKKGKKICWTSFRVIICCPLLWLGQKVKVHREPVQHCFWSQSEWTRWSSKVDV